MWSSAVQLELRKHTFILGSSSPRRREIVEKNLGISHYSVVTTTFEENLPKSNLSHAQYVFNTAEHKIPSIVEQLDRSRSYVVIAADTIVSCADDVLEKPETKENQLTMLKLYRQHGVLRVITAVHVCLVEGGEISRNESGTETTSLNFDTKLTDEELQFYVDKEEGLQVAGGFKYQELGCLLFNGIDGDYFNVVGLPVKKTSQLIESLMNSCL